MVFFLILTGSIDHMRSDGAEGAFLVRSPEALSYIWQVLRDTKHVHVSGVYRYTSMMCLTVFTKGGAQSFRYIEIDISCGHEVTSLMFYQFILCTDTYNIQTY